MEELPEDVLSNIFIRLLAKQLAQMRSVSKPWNALLSKKSLIKSHLHRSFHNNDEILLFCYADTSFRRLAFSAHPSRSPDLELTDFIKFPVKFKHDIDKVIGSVDGLICFKKHSWPEDCVLHIWNPSLSAISALPPYSLPYPSLATGKDPLRVNFRFGYDPKADDYKVVKLAFLLQTPVNYCRVQEWLQVEVYSRRKGSWKPITQRVPSHFTRISTHEEQQVCVDGHDGLLHWLGIIGEEKKGRTIVAFDLGAETFHEIPLPNSILQHHNASNRTNVLGVLAGKLCVMSYAYAGECEVWVMDEYGVVESWVKHHVFSQFHNIVPLGFTLHNEFLFQIDDDDDDDDGTAVYVDHGDRCFGLYDPVTAKTKVFEMFDPIRTFVGYVDSLVWVAPDERVITTKKRGNGNDHY